jgi:salicylate hydroxylase
VYPVSKDRLINIVAITTDPSKEGTVYEGSTTTTASSQEVLSVFEGWEEEVRALLRVSHNCHPELLSSTRSQCIKQPTKWAITTLNPLDRYASGRVILAGDAVRGSFSFYNSPLMFHCLSCRLMECLLIKLLVQGKQ